MPGHVHTHSHTHSHFMAMQHSIHLLACFWEIRGNTRTQRKREEHANTARKQCVGLGAKRLGDAVFNSDSITEKELRLGY